MLAMSHQQSQVHAKDGNNTPSYDTRETIDNSPDLMASTMQQQFLLQGLPSLDSNML